MNQGNFILREPEYEALLSILRKLLVDASAKVVFLVDKNGTLLATAGDAVGFDTTSLAELHALLNRRNVPEFEAWAFTGAGVFETLKAAIKLVLIDLKRGRRQ